MVESTGAARARFLKRLPGRTRRPDFFDCIPGGILIHIASFQPCRNHPRLLLAARMSATSLARQGTSLLEHPSAGSDAVGEDRAQRFVDRGYRALKLQH